MKMLLILILLFIYTTQAFAIKPSSISNRCLNTSKMIMFYKAITTLGERHYAYLRGQYNQGHYSEFEYNKVLKDKTTLLPNSLCKEDILFSINDYTDSLNKNCFENKKMQEVNAYTKEIASDLTGLPIKEIKNSFLKTKPVVLAHLAGFVNSYSKCNLPKKYVQYILSLNLSKHSSAICEDIIQILNKVRKDKVACSKN